MDVSWSFVSIKFARCLSDPEHGCLGKLSHQSCHGLSRAELSLLLGPTHSSSLLLSYTSGSSPNLADSAASRNLLAMGSLVPRHRLVMPALCPIKQSMF